VTLNRDLVDLSESSAEFSYHDAEAMNMIVSGEDGAMLEVGKVYMLPPTKEYPYGLARKVSDVFAIGDNEFAVTSEEPTLEEIITDYDIQGVFYPDYNNIIWGEGITGRVVTNEDVSPALAGASIVPIQPLGVQGDTISIRKLSAASSSDSGTAASSSKSNDSDDGDSDDFDATDDYLDGEPNITLKLGENSAEIQIEYEEDDVEISGSIALKDMNTIVEMSNQGIFGTEKLHKASASATVESSLECTGEIGDESKTICKIPFPLIAPFTTTLNLEIGVSGEITVKLEDSFLIEVGAIDTNGILPRLIHDVTDHDFSVNADGSAKAMINIAPTVSVAGIKILVAKAGVGAGVKAKALGSFCAEINAYVPLTVSIDTAFTSKKEFEIWTDVNSPFKLGYHVEDGEKLDKCTKEIGRISNRGSATGGSRPIPASSSSPPPASSQVSSASSSPSSASSAPPPREEPEAELEYVLSGQSYTMDILGFDMELPIEYRDKLELALNEWDQETLFYRLDNGDLHPFAYFRAETLTDFEESSRDFYEKNINTGLPFDERFSGFPSLPYSHSGGDSRSFIIDFNEENVLWYSMDSMQLPNGSSEDVYEARALIEYLNAEWVKMRKENIPKIQPAFDKYLKSIWQKEPNSFYPDTVILTGIIEKTTWYWSNEESGTWWRPIDGAYTGWHNSYILRLDTPIEEIKLMQLTGLKGGQEGTFENVEEIDITFSDAADYLESGDRVLVICELAASTSYARVTPISGYVTTFSKGDGFIRVD
jgi:hypothetical protein